MSKISNRMFWPSISTRWRYVSSKKKKIKKETDKTVNNCEEQGLQIQNATEKERFLQLARATRTLTSRSKLEYWNKPIIIRRSWLAQKWREKGARRFQIVKSWIIVHQSVVFFLQYCYQLKQRNAKVVTPRLLRECRE